MASLYRRPRSPHWWLRYKINGVWKSANTGLRVDSPTDTKRARILAEERRFDESAHTLPDTGWGWVRAWLASTAPTDLTRQSYLNRWRHVEEFLVEHDLDTPGSVRHEHVQAYLAARTKEQRHCGRPITRNTAVMEIKMLKMVLSEAVNRGLLERSPLARAQLKRDAPAEKPEITDQEQQLIEQRLRVEPVWMQRAFRIAIATGCRLKETRIFLRDVDLVRGTIRFPAPKGGRRKAYSIPLPQNLRPLFEEMREAGENVTLEFPSVPATYWRRFFLRIGLEHLCFHCTRVTFISRLARAGAPLSVAMRLVNHASATVHRVYQRFSLDDLAGWADAVAAPPPAPRARAIARPRRGK